MSLVAVLFAVPALAVLKDRGPVDPLTGYPAWYRDNGISAAAAGTAVPGTLPMALEPCKTTTLSANAVPPAPFCFPPVTPAIETFYAVSNAIATNANGITARLVEALEGSYAGGAVVPGQEITFARTRLTINTPTNFTGGTLIVTHPFGVETFPNVAAGARAVFFTEDVGLAGVRFDGALAGRIGPFIRWDVLAAGESLIAVPGIEEYIGDQSKIHTITGSPFNTNFLRVDLLQNGVLTLGQPQNLFTVVGKKYLTPIPSPLAIQRATYTRTPTGTSLDVFATATALNSLAVSDANTITPAINPATMAGNGGNYLGHFVLPPGAPIPAAVTVTNTTDVPPSVFTANVTDLVTVNDAFYDPSTNPPGVLTVLASSSDAPGGTFLPPVLSASGFGVVDAAGKTFATGAAPPASVTVASAAGGSATLPVRVLQTLAAGGGTTLTAVNDSFATNLNTAATFPVTANDSVPPPAAPVLAAVVITIPPAHGTAVPGVGAALGTVLYTPTLNYSGPDSFSYVLRDANGALSNTAIVTILVNFVAGTPVANPDAIVTRAGVAGTVALLANDVAAFGTTLDPASILTSALSNPAAGTLAVSPTTGVATFTPAAGFTGTVTATYSVATNALPLAVPPQPAVRSNTATITITVAANADVLGTTLVQFRTGIGQWRVNGTSTSVTAGTTVTIYNGSTTAAPVLVSGVPVVAGAWTWTSPNGSPAPSASRLILIVSTQGGQLVAAVTVRQ